MPSASTRRLELAGEAFLGVGGNSSDQSCAKEAVCLMDAQSSRCQSLARTANGTVNLDVDDFGVIVECDKTNTDEPQCAPMPRDCLTSSVFPHCHFRLRSQQDLLARTEELLTTQDGTNLDTHSYMLFFNDDQCSNLEGIKGLVSGKSNLTSVDDSIACNKAITCILAPEGEACGTVEASAKTSRVINAETTSDGRQALSCLDDGSCEFASIRCVKSDILKSCYVKWVGPTTLFDQPLVYVKAAGNGDLKLTGEDDSATSLVSSIAMIRYGWLSLVSAVFAYGV